MKRRIFLAASGTVGIATVVSGSSVISSAYSSISSNMLIEEFPSATKSLLDQFVADVTQNVQSLGLDRQLIARITTPTRIISKKEKGKKQEVIFKNKSGQSISLIVNGKHAKVSIA
jgi:hypothetical protein